MALFQLKRTTQTSLNINFYVLTLKNCNSYMRKQFSNIQKYEISNIIMEGVVYAIRLETERKGGKESLLFTNDITINAADSKEPANSKWPGLVAQAYQYSQIAERFQKQEDLLFKACFGYRVRVGSRPDQETW